MKFIKKNKELGVFIVIVLIVLIYTSFQTFLSNDDFPYMFLYRGETRITNLVQVAKNQVADYLRLSGRFFVHCVVQTLLIFDKKLWSVLNPVVIVSLLLAITGSVKTIKKEEKINYKYFIFSVVLFLLLFNYKYIIYWVAGSVNYVWVSLALFLFIYYYLKKGLDNNYLINALIIIMVSILHEMSMVFMIIFLIGHIVIKKIKHEKIDKKYLLYILAIAISSAFILLSPGNNHRMGLETTWGTLNLFEKIKLSLPVVSYNLFNIRNYQNIIPVLFIISIVYKLFKSDEKKNHILGIIILVILVLAALVNNGYVYLLLAIVSFIGIAYIYIKNKEYNLIIISLGFYAIVYSNILVPNYMDGRPNFFFYLYAIMMINIFISELINKEYMKYFLLIMFIMMLGIEIYIYSFIGSVHKKRLTAIETCQKEECQTLVLPEISKKYSQYHIDANSPNSKKYYTYRFYRQYYNLPENIDIKHEVIK